MLLVKALPLMCFIAVFLVPDVSAQCQTPLPLGTAVILETALPNSGAIFEQTIIDGGDFGIEVLATLKTGRPTNITGHFDFVSAPNDKYRVILKEPIDLDTDNLDIARDSKGGITLNISFACNREANGVKYYRQINVKAVDEFPAVFQPHIVINVREDYPIFLDIVNIKDKVKDKDLFDSSTKSFRFKIRSNDEDPTFTLTAEGTLYAEKQLDYEIVKEYFLNVSAINNQDNSIVLNSVIKVEVQNINDNGVAFFTTTCNQDCPHFQTQINVDFKGVLSDHLDILAHDDDGDEIHYSFAGGSPYNYLDYLSIDPLTGILTMRESVARSKVDLLIVIVKATTSSKLQNSRELSVLNEAITFGLISFKQRLSPISALDVRRMTTALAARNGPHTFCMLLFSFVAIVVSII